MEQTQTAIEPYVVSTFYKFVPLPNYVDIRESIKESMLSRNVKGTITLAPEGINATITGTRNDVDYMMRYLQARNEIGELHWKESFVDYMPFLKTKVKVKPQLISLGVPVDPTVCVGTYVDSKDWNALITQPDIITIDTRNDYEYRIGRFKGAINPATTDFKETVTFTEQTIDPQKHKRVAMYCTGGIRCEKYSSYLLDYGIEEVYHLKGGILQYLEDIPESESLWEGKCYVFDDRVAVNHDLSDAVEISQCDVCGQPLEPHDRAHADYIEDSQCPYCFR